MDTVDWRALLQPDFRQGQVNEIIRKLSKYHLSGDEDKSVEVRKIAQNYERKIYTGATSQADYLQKISLMILSIEERSDWRAQLHPDSRQRIVNKITETLGRHLVSGPEGLNDFRRSAERLEERIFTEATSQSDYLRKISLRMLTMETDNQKAVANPMPSNPGGNSNEKRIRRLPIWTKDYHMA